MMMKYLFLLALILASARAFAPAMFGASQQQSRCVAGPCRARLSWAGSLLEVAGWWLMAADAETKLESRV